MLLLLEACDALAANPLLADQCSLAYPSARLVIIAEHFTMVNSRTAVCFDVPFHHPWLCKL